MNIIEGDAFADGFTVSNLRFSDDAFYAVFSSHAFDVDVKMEFAHPGNDSFFGFWVEMDAEGRIFALEFVKCFGELGGFFLSWFDGQRNHRLGHKH